MRPIFYDNFVDIDDLMTKLSSGLSHLEQEEIHELVEEILHQRILEIILHDLPIEHHENFLLRFYQNPNDHHLFLFLKSHSPQIEDKIREVVIVVKNEIQCSLAEYDE